MLVYCDQEFSGVRQHKHGGTENDHIKALEKMGFKVDKKQSECPEDLWYLYDLFKKIRFSIVPNDNKLSLIQREPLTYAVINSYTTNIGFNLEGWEIDVLLRIDSVLNRYM